MDSSTDTKKILVVRQYLRQLCDNFTPFMSKSFQIWDTQTNTHTKLQTFRLIERIGREGQIFERKKEKNVTLDTRHVTPWPLTRDMWHMTYDMWHVTHDGVWKFSQDFSFLALTVWDRQCLEDSEQKHDLLNQWIIQWCVFRTAQASMGWLKT